MPKSEDHRVFTLGELQACPVDSIKLSHPRVQQTIKLLCQPNSELLGQELLRIFKEHHYYLVALVVSGGKSQNRQGWGTVPCCFQEAAEDWAKNPPACEDDTKTSTLLTQPAQEMFADAIYYLPATFAAKWFRGHPRRLTTYFEYWFKRRQQHISETQHYQPTAPELFAHGATDEGIIAGYDTYRRFFDYVLDGLNTHNSSHAYTGDRIKKVADLAKEFAQRYLALKRNHLPHACH